jgi:hypothetical protein
MTRSTTVRKFAIAAGLLGAISSLVDTSLHGQGAEGLVMVANKTNASASNMTKGEAKKMMLGQTLTWPGGGPVTIVVTPAGSSEHSAVLTKVCGMSEGDFTRYQLQVAFTGRTPTTFHEEHSVAGVTSFLKSHPGAVGFLHKNEVGEDLKVVLPLE